MEKIYVIGHSDKTDETTFVPTGKVLHFHAQEDHEVSTLETSRILQGYVEPRGGSKEAGATVANHQLTPESDLVMAVWLKRDYENTITTYQEPTKLCMGDCDSKKGEHTCAGILGSLTSNYSEIHLVCCRGGSATTGNPSDPDRDDAYLSFKKMNHAERLKEWEFLCNHRPRLRDKLLETDIILMWLPMVQGRSYEKSRGNSQFALIRGTSEEAITRIGMFWSGSPKPELELESFTTDWYRQRGKILEILNQDRNKFRETWRTLSRQSREDLAAVQTEGFGARIVKRLEDGQQNQEVWESSIGKAEWVRFNGETMASFGNAIYEVSPRSSAEPVWPNCQYEMWCWIEFATGPRLVQLNSEGTRRQATFEEYRNQSAHASEIEQSIKSFLGCDHITRRGNWDCLIELYPDEEDYILHHPSLSHFLEVCKIENRAALRPSQFPLMKMVDASINPEADISLAFLWDEWNRQQDAAIELVTRIVYTTEDIREWNALSEESREDVVDCMWDHHYLTYLQEMLEKHGETLNFP